MGGSFLFIDAAAPGGRRWLSIYGQTRAEVESKLADAMAARGRGITPPRGALTVAEYLASWIDQAELLVSRSVGRIRRVTQVTTTKAKGSARAVPIPEPLRDVLASHKLHQRETRLAGEEWDESWGDLVFCTPSGEPLKAGTVSGAFRNRLLAAGLRRRRFHDLRHGAATLWLAAGVDLKTVSALLGHSTIATTANIYTSVLDSLKTDAAERMTRLLARPVAHTGPRAP